MNKSWRNVVIGNDEEVKSGSSIKGSNGASATVSAGASGINPVKPGNNPVKPGNSVNPTATSPKIPVAAENDAKRHERLLVVYAPLLGQRVTVFLYDGAVFEGTLDSFDTESTKNEFALILRMATMLRPGREVIDPSIKAGITFELMNIRFDDMAELKAAAASSSSSGGIGTDAAISKKKGDFGKERELHRWLPEDESIGNPATLSTSMNASNSSWDQFATNEKLFGLKTDFNEEMYTTKLDRNSAHIKANEAKAERIAKEIMMASAGGNVHLAEERGQNVNEGDEELLYGAVIRASELNNKTTGSTGASLPPGFTSTTPEPAATNTSSSTKSTLNPDAPEFKLNVDAPEFKPSSSYSSYSGDSSRITYYNQPRRNLIPMNAGYNNYYTPYAPYPQQVPYYYVPPMAPVAMPVNTVNNNTNGSLDAQSQPTQSTSTSSTQMNPNAADFVMPQYYAPPPQPYYGGYNGYYNNNNNGYYQQ